MDYPATTRKIPSASFNRPADTIAYALGDLVANSTVAGSVVPMTFKIARIQGGCGVIRRVRLQTSNPSLSNAQFRVHLFQDLPAVTGGDNAALAANGIAKRHFGTFDVTLVNVHSDGAGGAGPPVTGAEVAFDLDPGKDTVYALLEARAAYAPLSGETFKLFLEVTRD